jgi:hypothetical protein
MSELGAFQKQFPTVRFMSAGGRRTYAELRALGVSQARSAVIALTEDHCTPDPDWCDRILQAHKASHAAVGGAVEKAAPDTALNWALYLADYGRYMNPRAAGVSRELTDCNVSYKSAALRAITPVWQTEFHEPVVHGALHACGQSLWFSPHIIVHQQRSLQLGKAIKDRYAFGRLFGAGRFPAPDYLLFAVSLRRLIYSAWAILLPVVLSGRVAAQVFHKRRCVVAFFRALPALVLLNSAWACGEFVGSVTGLPNVSLTPQARSAGARPQKRTAI